jgi:hypothetical protein
VCVKEWKQAKGKEGALTRAHTKELKQGKAQALDQGRQQAFRDMVQNI